MYPDSRQNVAAVSKLPTVTRIGVNEEWRDVRYNNVTKVLNSPISNMVCNIVGTVNYCGW
jgi:hypothetical protein